MTLQGIAIDWPAPAGVRAFSTTRRGGCSRAPYDTFNLGKHVGDDAECVSHNRKILRQELDLPQEPAWLEQVHGNRVVNLDMTLAGHSTPQGDGSITSRVGPVCVVMTADCLPVLLCNRAGNRVAALHAGWRGLADGILEAGVDAMNCEPGNILAWLGPAIGPHHFEVGDEVYRAFVRHDEACTAAFTGRGNGKYLADLYLLAQRRLRRSGVEQVYGGTRCTFSEEQVFYSFRRDRVCGRMASMIWLE